MKGSKNIIQPKVIFKEGDHSYWFEGKKTISMTTLIGMFCDPMDVDYWQTYKAFQLLLGDEYFKDLKAKFGYNKWPHAQKPPTAFFDKLTAYVNPADFFKAKTQIRDEWKASGTNGTAFHLDRENEIYDAGYLVNPWDSKPYTAVKHDKRYDNESLVNDLSELPDGVYPELLVWWELNDNIVITGQIDVAFLGTDEDGRFLDVDDFKTNKKLGSRSSSNKFNPPFQHLPSSKLVKYNLQQSGYSYILEKWGYRPRNQAITHYKDYDPTTGKRYEFAYLRDEIEQMFEIVNEQYK